MEEKIIGGKKRGMLMLLVIIAVFVLSVALIVVGAAADSIAPAVVGFVVMLADFVLMPGLKILKPQEALVLTLFGKICGNAERRGLLLRQPLLLGGQPGGKDQAQPERRCQAGGSGRGKRRLGGSGGAGEQENFAENHDPEQQPPEDQRLSRQSRGDGIAVTWKVVDTAKAVFNVDNYKEYLSLQCDSALRNIVRIYPYDVAPGVDTTGDGIADEGSLRGSSEVVASRIRDEIQSRVNEAGIEIIEARITYLAYAPEIAAVMLQRQQASAIIDARKMIVDGAVGMVEMALERLSENNVVTLDEERKAAMVSNLLVVLCGNHDAQPVVNSGSLY